MNRSLVTSKDAVAAATRALAVEPSSRLRRLELARLLEEQGHQDDAQRVLRDGVGRDRLCSIRRALDEMRGSLGLAPLRDAGDWQLLAVGRGNVCIVKQGGPLPLHTKVVDTRLPGARKEARLAEFTRAHDTCPTRLLLDVLDVRYLARRHLALITTRFVAGSRPTQGFIEPVLDAWIDLSIRCKPEKPLLDIVARRPLVDTLRVLNVYLREKRAFHSGALNWLDVGVVARAVFWWMRQHARRIGASWRIEQAIRECEEAWRVGRASRVLRQPRHLSLTHGDFHPGNQLIDSERGRCVLCDLAQLSVGLPGNDLARHLAYEPFSSPYVQERVFGYVQERAPTFFASAPLSSAFGLALLAEKVQRQRVVRLDAMFDEDIGPLAAWLRSRLAEL